MNANNLDLVFAPVTRAQARLFGGLAGMLDRRGVGCRFAVPSGEVAVPISDDWRELVLIQEAPDVGQEGEVPAGPRLADPLIPPDIGAYDAWRGGWSPEQRAEAAAAAVRFWRVCLERWCPGAVVLWNGRDHVFVEAAAWAARNLDIDVICMELGPLRRAPMTVAISRGGINAAAQFRRPELLETALTPWEAERLADARARCRNGVRPEYGPRPFAFLPLQVDDDTQLYYYAPHFADQRAMLAAVVAALPDDLPLVVKVHPLADERRG
ncbi:MAG: hypothetical protein KKB50_02570, partial [Planctomycetes bacterium]|nr:hypothetical protein [Planctomycetota bacterium]